MTYRTLYEDRKKNIDRLLRFTTYNLVVFAVTMILLVEGWVTKGIVLGVGLGFVALLLCIIKAGAKERVRLKSEVLETHGNDEIIAVADEYFGFVSSEKWGHTLLLLFYLAIVLLVFSLVYKSLGISDILLIVVDVLHLLLMAPMLKGMHHHMFSNAIFTNGNLILNFTATIDLKRHMKIQVMEQIKGGYIMEINTGDRFTRLCMSELVGSVFLTHYNKINKEGSEQ